MSHALPPRPAEAVREVRRDLVEARDDQLLRVVGIMDGLADRGAGDAVLAPVRNRLRALHPPRPLRLARLLFLPFDPLIVDPARWRPGGPHLPRSALSPLAELIRERTAPESLTRIDALIANGRTSVGCPGEAGLLVWSHSAAALCQAIKQPPPAGWSAAGLPDQEFVPILSGLTPVLLAEQRLRVWEQRRWQANDDPALALLLRETQALGPRPWGMMLSLIMLRFPRSPAPLEAAVAGCAQPPGPMREAAEAALRLVLERVEGADRAPSPATKGAASTIGQMADLLEGLTSRLPDQMRRQRALQARAQLHQGCLQNFRSGLEKTLLGPIQALAQSRASDQVVEQVEAAARRLRQFEGEARRLGGGAQYDGLIGEAAAGLQAAAALEPIDRARLLEILQGPAAAWRSLQAPSGGGTGA